MNVPPSLTVRRTIEIAVLVIVSGSCSFRVGGIADKSEPDDRLSGRPAEPSIIGRKWISEMMAEAETSFDMSTAAASDACRRDFRVYSQHARNQTVWAIRMMESTEWPRIGVFSGATTHLGNYAECLRARGPRIRGQYCLAEATYDFSSAISEQPKPGWTEWPAENASAWTVIKMHDRNPFRKSRRSLVWAMCVPSSCTAVDLQTALNDALRPIFKAQNMEITSSVNPGFCTIQDGSRSFAYFNNATYVFLFVILIVVSATIYDLFIGIHQVSEHDSSSSMKLFKCFSAIESGKSLIRHSSADAPFLHFLKIALMFFVIWGHTTTLYYMFPRFETEEMEMSFRPWSFELLGTVSLNVFFLVSGFLRAYYFNFTPEADGGVWFFVRSFTIKWLRLVPASGLMIICFIATSPFLENGPFSEHLMKTELKNCANNWWTNLLAVQNFRDYREMCHPQSWYIAVEIQLFIIGTLLLMALRKSRKYGAYLIISTFLYSIVATFVKLYSNATYELFTAFYTMNTANFRESFPILFMIHAMTFYRVGPYLMGYATAFVTKSLIENGYKFSQMQSILLICFTIIIGFGIQPYGFVFFMAARPVDPLEIAIFGVLQPILFVLPFASFICINFVSGFGFINSIFEQKLFTPVGRLGFSVFLVGLEIQSYHVLSQRRTLPRFSRIELYWWMAGDVVILLIIAFGFYLGFEGPVNKIIDSFIRPYLVEKSNQTQKELLISGNKNSYNSIALRLDANSSSGAHASGSVRARKSRSNSFTNQTDAKQKYNL